MSAKFMQDVIKSQQLAHDLRCEMPWVSAESALLMAFFHVSGTSGKAEKQMESSPKLSDEEIEQITKWVSGNFFPQMMMSEIYVYATGKPWEQKKSRATKVLLSTLSVTRTSSGGRVRYSKPTSAPTPVVWASN